MRCEVILSTGTKIRIQFLLDIDFVNSRKQKEDDWNWKGLDWLKKWRHFVKEFVLAIQMGGSWKDKN